MNLKVQTLITLLAGILASCAPAVAPKSTATSVPPTLTSAAKVLPIMTPSPMTANPTFAIITIITPDAMQVERWKEYQNALASKLIWFLHPEEVLCEWEILGQSNQEV
jgi:hypothetical protein